jgi:hypothetical protein
VEHAGEGGVELDQHGESSLELKLEGLGESSGEEKAP